MKTFHLNGPKYMCLFGVPDMRLTHITLLNACANFLRGAFVVETWRLGPLENVTPSMLPGLVVRAESCGDGCLSATAFG